MRRLQEQLIYNDLQKKIVLIVGPRQVGKTYLAKQLGKRFSRSLYLSYDQPSDRQIIKEQAWLDGTDLVILDELHKMPNWKNYLKGLFDTKPEKLKILVTGSARLDLIRQWGDSLAGRFFLHHLMPLSLAELKKTEQTSDLSRLLERGGFPEAYLAENKVEAERWRMQYTNSLLSADVFDIDNIRDLKAFRLTFDLLRNRVGSPISLKSLAEDIAVSPHTIKHYIQILESLYVIFRVTTHSKNIARSILKEPKIYFYDTALVEGSEGVKFENFAAVSLLKDLLFRRDYQAENCSLHYLRTKESVEIDFLIAKDNKPEKIIEVKMSDADVSAPLKYFHEKYHIPAMQLVKKLNQERKSKNILVVNAQNYLENLNC